MSVFATLKRKIRRSFKRRGVLGTVLFYFSVWRFFKKSEVAGDLITSVDTGGKIAIGDLAINSPHRVCGVGYQATPQSVFDEMLRALPVRYEDFTFIDIGSGKGAALLMASHYPFRAITGIEFAPELNDIANRNICQYHYSAQRCHRIQSICADAAEFVFPDEPLVVYMFNPFDGRVMAPLIQNLERSMAARNHEIYLVYYNPVVEELFCNNPRFSLLKARKARWTESLNVEYSIFRMDPKRALAMCGS